MPIKAISNEDILELLQESMQLTSEGLDNLEGRLGKRIDETNKHLDEIRIEQAEMKRSIQRQELQIGKLTDVTTAMSKEILSIHSDLNEIFDELAHIKKVLGAGEKPHNLKARLQALSDEIQAIAKQEGFKIQ